MHCMYFCIFTLLAICFGYSEGERIARASIESCTGCALAKYPEIKKFIEFDILDLDVTPLPLACSTPDDHIEKEHDGKESVSSHPSDQISEFQEKKLSSSPESISSDTSSSSRFRQSLTSPRDLGHIEMPYSEDVMKKFHGRFRTPSPKEEIIPLKITQERLLELLETKPLHPAKIILSLKETQTFFLLDRPSLTALEGSEEAESIKKDNAQYDYLTIGEGRYRYKKDAETQTKWKVWKSKGVWAPAAETQPNIAEASTYDLYQSFTTFHEYEDVAFKQVPGLLPQLVLYDKYDQELERHPFRCSTREECCQVLLEKGFKRKAKALPGSHLHNDM